MADGFALALQKGLRAALVADAAVTAIVGTRIYDEPPQGVTYPYLRFGAIEAEALDTDSTAAATVFVTIEGHSRSASGRVEAVQMAEAVRSVLHRQESAVTTTGFVLVELIFEAYSATRDAEGRGYTSVISLRAMLDPA